MKRKCLKARRYRRSWAERVDRYSGPILVAIWVALVALGFAVALFGCDTVVSPAQARAIPGSPDFCQIAETGFITASDRSEQRHFQRQLEEHCFGRLGEDGEPEDKEPTEGGIGEDV